jgi:hypothetical protein
MSKPIDKIGTEWCFYIHMVKDTFKGPEDSDCTRDVYYCSLLDRESTGSDQCCLLSDMLKCPVIVNMDVIKRVKRF